MWIAIGLVIDFDSNCLKVNKIRTINVIYIKPHIISIFSICEIIRLDPSVTEGLTDG